MFFVDDFSSFPLEEDNPDDYVSALSSFQLEEYYDLVDALSDDSDPPL